MWQAAIMNLSQHLRALLLLMTLWTPLVHAWGNFGHRVTALIAESLLTTAARQQVRQLLGDESLAHAAIYMDEQRALLRQRWPESDQWHYDNVAVCGHAVYQCPNGNCATRQIERFRRVLSNRHTDNSERAMALRLLVHMLGDIHQPLHMADNADHGGNTLYARLSPDGEPYRLHEIMDTLLIRQNAGEQRSKEYARTLRRRYQSKFASWQQGSISSWAQQTHQLAVQQTYGELPGFACHGTHQTITLSAGYIQDAERYLPEQLARAGAHIAAVLNRSLR